jgi:hypothetical protein
MTKASRRSVAVSAFAIVWLGTTLAADQGPSTLLPPQCKGKTGAELDQCVRDLTAPSGVEIFEPIERKTDPRALMNCNMINRADQGYCIARNEIVITCRAPARYSDFDACVNRLITRPQPPRLADCTRAASNQRELCALRNKFMNECLKEPWLYFICLGEKLYPK